MDAQTDEIGRLRPEWKPPEPPGLTTRLSYERFTRKGTRVLLSIASFVTSGGYAGSHNAGPPARQ